MSFERWLVGADQCFKAGASNDKVEFLLWLAFELDALWCNALDLTSLKMDIVPTQSRIVIVGYDTSLTPRRVFRSELFPHFRLVG